MRQNVLILFGGKSPEHEISVRTAFNVAESIDRTLYNPFFIGISRSGHFYYVREEYLKECYHSFQQILDDEGYACAIIHHKVLTAFYDSSFLENFTWADRRQAEPLFQEKIDVIFPLLHGIYGEDGVIQGYLQTLDIPYVGCQVKSSAVCMDKDITKTILKAQSIPVVDWIAIKEYEDFSPKSIIETLGLPLFVKASEQGSSIGTYKASTISELELFIQKAFEYGPKVIIEKAIDKAREIEFAILGKGNALTLSCAGEIIPSEKYGFYTYDAKYMDPDGAGLKINPYLKKHVLDQMLNYAKKAFQLLDCSGLSRVDFFLTKDDDVYLNEINTMPGFTSFSMYPKLMIEMGISYPDLLTKLIQLAVDSFNEKKKYKLV